MRICVTALQIFFWGSESPFDFALAELAHPPKGLQTSSIISNIRG